MKCVRSKSSTSKVEDVVSVEKMFSTKLELRVESELKEVLRGLLEVRKGNRVEEDWKPEEVSQRTARVEEAVDSPLKEAVEEYLAKALVESVEFPLRVTGKN
jgi:hypothetical protein